MKDLCKSKEDVYADRVLYKSIESQMPSMAEVLSRSYRSMVANEMTMMLESFRNAERTKIGSGVAELQKLFRSMELNETPYSPEQCNAMRAAVENFDTPFELVFR